MKSYLNKVFHGDALQLLRVLPTASIDAVITDAMYGTSKICRYDWGVDPARGDPVKHWLYHQPIYEQCLRVLKPGSALAWGQSAKFERYYDHWFRGHRKWTLLRHIGQRVSGHLWVMQTREQGPIELNRSGVIECALRSSLKRFGHPCIKPVEELAFIIESLTKPGDIVLDCFCGLGSTLLAAQALDRHWIGCDISNRYCQVSMARLQGRMSSDTVIPSQRRPAQDSQHSKKTSVESAHKMDGTAAPQWLFDALDQQVRTLTGIGFELDAAASRHNAKCSDYYDEEINALSRDWSDWDVVYCNPPFSATLMERFAEKALCAAKTGTTVVMLLPFWPGYPWFQELVRHGQMQTVSGPIAFKHDNGKTVMQNNGRFSNSIVVITLGPHVRPGTNGTPIRKPLRLATVGELSDKLLPHEPSIHD